MQIKLIAHLNRAWGLSPPPGTMIRSYALALFFRYTE
jgi:hypothetical protein